MQLRIIRRFSIAAVAILATSLPSFLWASENSQDTATKDSAKSLSAVRLDGNYFSRDGHRFIPVGANWVPAKAAMQWPTQWDPKAIEADFARDQLAGLEHGAVLRLAINRAHVFAN